MRRLVVSPPSLVAIRPIGPVSCGTAAWRFRGQLHVTAAVKSTFLFAPDAFMRLSPPDEIQPADIHYNGDPRRSLKLPGDLSPYRTKADVLLTGHAYSPTPGGVFASIVRLVVLRGHVLLEKSFQVVGDRTSGAPVKFERLPLQYERSFGGPGWDDNPIGTGLAEGSPPPNLIDPTNPRKTVGFGPIARSWPARVRSLGSADPAALARPIAAIPSDLDFAYFQDAPPDQQIAPLVGDEWVVLEGLHPSCPVLETQLPGARAVGKVYGLTQPRDRGHPIALSADALHIDTDRASCSVTWRATFPVASEDVLPNLVLVVGVEIAGQPLAWPDPGSLFPDDSEKTTVFDVQAAREALAARASARESAHESAPAPARESAPAPAPALPSLEGTLELSVMQKSAVLAGEKPLPFASRPLPPPLTPSSTPVVRLAPPLSPLESTLELSSSEKVESIPLPFTGAKPGSIPSPSPSRPALTPPTPPPPPAPPPSAFTSPLEGTLTLTAEEAIAATATASLPFVQILSEPPATAPSEPPPATPPAIAPQPAPPPAAPSAPPVDTAKFFHSIPRREPSSEIPLRTTDAVPVLYETSAARPGPLVTFTVPWQIKPPKASLTIAIKATFSIVPGAPAELRPEADMPSGDIFIDGDPQKSLAYASDFAVFKARADVTLTGHAYAPAGSAPMSEVRFQLGSGAKGFDRHIAVFGDRLWRWTGGVLSRPTDPLPYKKIPLHYENAFGGPGYPPNPVGAGLLSKGALPAGLRMPNLEDPAHLLTNPSETPPPASFAPVPLAWQERWSKVGSYGDKWLKERWPYFPDNVDWSITQSAPRPQQLEALQGDEPFELAGMHPKLPVVRGSLPKLRARCFAQKTQEAGGELVEVLLRLDTAHFDADAMTINLVWRGLIDVSDDDAPELALLFVITEKLGAPPAPLKAVRARLAEALKLAEPAPAPADPPPAANEPLADRLRADGASEREIAAVTAPSPAAHKAGPPPPPDAEAIADRLRRAGVSENEVLSILAALKGEEPRAPTPSPAKLAAPPPPPPPPPNPAALAEDLRAAGLGENEIASLMNSVAEVSNPPRPPAPTPRDRVIRMLAAGDPFDGLDLAGADLSALDFSGRSLARANLKGVNLRGARLASADLSAAQISAADLTDAILDGATLDLADLSGSTLSMASFAGASIARADLTGAKADRANFRGAKGQGARFTAGSFPDARFDEAHLPAADFTRAALDGAVFDRAVLPDVRLHGARGAKVSFNEARMPGARADGAAFPHGSFRAVVAPGSAWNKAQLDEATWSGASLRGASFFRASCKKANLSACDLADARLDRAKLAGARLQRTNLMTASLQQADLKNADLRWANLYACNTWKAALSGALFDQANLARSTLKARS